MSSQRAIRSRLLIGVAVLAVAWCLPTLAFLLARAALDGLHFSGTTAGLFAGDPLRYLAWIRDAGLHGLIADPYQAGAPHVYLEPVFLISGLLWRAGVSLQAAYLVWTPVALAVLVWGYVTFTARFLSGAEQAAALALALLFLSPLVPLFDYGGIVDANGANFLIIAAGHSAAYWQAWGFLPTVIALGLMPVFVLGLVRKRPTPRSVAATSIAGLLVAWLHPWGGIELVLVATGLLVLRRREAPTVRKQLVIPGAATALPLVYYAVLAIAEPAWSLWQVRAGTAGPVWPLVFTCGPLLLVAWPALRRRSASALDQFLLGWLAAVVLTYIALPSTHDAALEGSTLPLSVLAVRGWRHLHAPRSVLATPYLGSALPALSGLLDGQVATAVDAVFDDRARTGTLTRLIERDHVTAVASDCLPRRTDLSGELAPLGFRPQRYGCAVLHRLTAEPAFTISLHPHR